MTGKARAVKNQKENELFISFSKRASMYDSKLACSFLFDVENVYAL